MNVLLGRKYSVIHDESNGLSGGRIVSTGKRQSTLHNIQAIDSKVWQSLLSAAAAKLDDLIQSCYLDHCHVPFFKQKFFLVYKFHLPPLRICMNLSALFYVHLTIYFQISGGLLCWNLSPLQCRKWRAPYVTTIESLSDCFVKGRHASLLHSIQLLLC